MTETIVLRKGSSSRTISLDGTVVRVTVGRQKPSRVSWLNGVMARAKRDGLVADLVTKGWVIAASKQKASKAKRPSLDAKDILVAGKAPIRKATPAKQQAWPSGYVEMMGRLGAGELEGLLLLSPSMVTKRTNAWKKVAKDAAVLFSNLRECFPDEDEASVIVIAASQNGDVIGFPGARPKELFLFPRGSNRVIAIGSTFQEALGAWCFGEDIGPRRVEGRRARFRGGK